MAIIITRHLTKRFKDIVAVDDVNLEVEDSEGFGLLGPNGAGKTSLIRMITAVSPPTQGNIWVLGKELGANAREIKGLLGVVPQGDNLDEDLTVYQNLIVFARYFNISGKEAQSRAQEVLEFFQLTEKSRSQIKELSGGMRRRLLIARALINRPRVMVLDEPTVGLDPQARHLVWQKLMGLKSQGVTQLLSTHNMDEAAYLCNRVAIMHRGKLLSVDSPQALVARVTGNEVLEIEVNPGNKAKIMEGLTKSGLDFVDAGDRLDIFRSDREDLKRKLATFSDRLRQRPATLEDVFLRLTGITLTE